MCVRTQIAKTAYLPAEYIPPTFWLGAPSPYSAGWRWGLLSRKFFFIFQNIVSTRQVFTRYSLSAFIFSRFMLVWLRFGFTSCRWELRLRYNFSISYFRFYITTRILIFIFLFSRLVFTRINFVLSRHCRFYALTLQLFISLTLLLIINKHLCLCEFVLCLF